MTVRHLRNGEVGTASRILDVAERLVQDRGFNGFSYADVAVELHLSKAALHYHFTGKAELGEALIRRYTARFVTALDALDRESANAAAKLEGYASLYLDVLRNKRMCLCGMLAAEYQTLPTGMQNAVIHFFDANENWLERIVEQGQQAGTIHGGGSPKDIARAIMGGLEGAMLVARPYGDITRFQAAAMHLLAGFVAGQSRSDGAARANVP